MKWRTSVRANYTHTVSQNPDLLYIIYIQQNTQPNPNQITYMYLSAINFEHTSKHVWTYNININIGTGESISLFYSDENPAQEMKNNIMKFGHDTPSLWMSKTLT